MIIHAGEYILRTFTNNDLMLFYNIAHDQKIKDYVPNSYPEDLQEAYEILETYIKGDCINDFYLLIEKQNEMIGAIIAVRTISRILDVSTIISKQYRGQGIMTKMLNAFINWLKNSTDYEKLSFAIKKDNIPSIRQVEKCNAVLKKDIEDDYIYEIIL